MSSDVPNDYTAATDGAVLFDHSDASKIELAGPDARLFLHNLCTQDVKNLPIDTGAETFLTTAKARVVAHGAVSHVSWRGSDALWFDTVPGPAERVLQHLNRYLISEQVEPADRTREVAMLRLVGPAAAAMLGPIFHSTLPPMKPWHHVSGVFDGSQVIIRHHLSLNLPGYDCFCESNRAPDLQNHLIAAGATPGDEPTHELLRVEAGWPLYGIDMDENRFVVEVGRTAQAISYTKGCFLGQEPIVMARDRGQVNRMLLGVLCGDGPALAKGTKLLKGETEVGEITSSVVSPRLGQAIALAYLRRGHQEPGTVLTTDPASGRRKAVVSALPFGAA